MTTTRTATEPATPPSTSTVAARNPISSKPALSHQNLLRLDQNTNVLGPNPAIAKAGLPADVSLYPEPNSERLVAALAEHHNLDPACIVVTRGSDEALELLAKAFAIGHGPIAYPVPSFERYPVLGPHHGVPSTAVPNRGLSTLDVDGLLATKAALTLVASPNNPTGNRVPGGELRRLATEAKGIVALDEAYIEYAGLRNSLLGLVALTPNLVVLRTFSKAYALAGLRVGWAAAHPETARKLRNVKAPFNVDGVAAHIATFALDEQEWLDGCVGAVRIERERLADQLTKRGCRVHPSDANFLLVRVPEDPNLLASRMKNQGVAVRPYAEGALAGHVRITVGGPRHTEATLAAFDAALTAMSADPTRAPQSGASP